MLVETRNVDVAGPAPLSTSARAIEPKINPLVTLGFFWLIALSLAFGGRRLITTLSLAWNDERYTQILLIIPITASLIYLDWRTLGKPAQRNLPLGLGLLVIATMVSGALVLDVSLARAIPLSVANLYDCDACHASGSRLLDRQTPPTRRRDFFGLQYAKHHSTEFKAQQLLEN
jgi:hypothetical protein